MVSKEEKAKACRDIINNELNAAWTGSTPQLLLFHLSYCPAEDTLAHISLDTAQQSVRSRSTVNLMGGELSLKFSAQFSREDVVDAAYCTKMTCISDDRYPDYWVAYLCMERPADETKYPCRQKRKFFTTHPPPLRLRSRELWGPK